MATRRLVNDHDDRPAVADVDGDPGGQPDARSDPLDGWSLPAWTYHDADFHAAELALVIRPSWQLVCHASDVTAVGDWHSLEVAGESVIVVRGADGAVRAFTNVCRHRGSRLVDGASGCARKLVCPYHAWTYDLDGRLTGIPSRADYPGLDPDAHGLTPVGLEAWHGFLFVRLEDDGGPSVAEMMAPHEAEVAPYRFDELRALGRVTLRPRPVNWKNVADNYSDGLHIPVAHPGLTRLFGRSYGVASNGRVDRMWGDMVERPSANLSERVYQAHLPDLPHLPPEARRRWLYFKLWPNTAFDIYPDQVDFMQFLPTGPTTTLIREISYVLPDAFTPPGAERRLRAARYANWRINRRVNAEDTELIERVQAGMASRSFTMGPLGQSEVALRGFCAAMRARIPQARQEHAPPPGWAARISEERT